MITMMMVVTYDNVP